MSFARGALRQVMSAVATQSKPVKREGVTRQSAVGAGALLPMDDDLLGRTKPRRRGASKELIG